MKFFENGITSNFDLEFHLHSVPTTLAELAENTPTLLQLTNRQVRLVQDRSVRTSQ